MACAVSFSLVTCPSSERDTFDQISVCICRSDRHHNDRRTCNDDEDVVLVGRLDAANSFVNDRREIRWSAESSRTSSSPAHGRPFGWNENTDWSPVVASPKPNTGIWRSLSNGSSVWPIVVMTVWCTTVDAS